MNLVFWRRKVRDGDGFSGAARSLRSQFDIGEDIFSSGVPHRKGGREFPAHRDNLWITVGGGLDVSD